MKEKDPIAVELGKRGGRKGGKRRNEVLTEQRRKEIAFIGSVYGRIARGAKVTKEEITLAESLKKKV